MHVVKKAPTKSKVRERVDAGISVGILRLVRLPVDDILDDDAPRDNTLSVYRIRIEFSLSHVGGFSALGVEVVDIHPLFPSTWMLDAAKAVVITGSKMLDGK